MADEKIIRLRHGGQLAEKCLMGIRHRIEQPADGVGDALAGELLRPAGGIDVIADHGFGQPLEAEEVEDLHQRLVVRRTAHGGADAQARAVAAQVHDIVVVSPDEAGVGEAHQQIHDLAGVRAAIAVVAAEIQRGALVAPGHLRQELLQRLQHPVNIADDPAHARKRNVPGYGDAIAHRPNPGRV